MFLYIQGHPALLEKDSKLDRNAPSCCFVCLFVFGRVRFDDSKLMTGHKKRKKCLFDFFSAIWSGLLVSARRSYLADG